MDESQGLLIVRLFVNLVHQFVVDVHHGLNVPGKMLMAQTVLVYTGHADRQDITSDGLDTVMDDHHSFIAHDGKAMPWASIYDVKYGFLTGIPP